MKLWRKNNRADREWPSVLKAILIRCNQQLIKIAYFLQQKTNSYSTRKKKILLLLFLVVFVIESSIAIIQSFSKRNTSSILITGIKTLRVENNFIQTPKISKAELLKIQRFKNYIDSLNTTVQGRTIKESLLHDRPNLMDSVNFLVNHYLEQSKTEGK